MITILSDHNMEGQAGLLWGMLAAEGWLEICSARFAQFSDVGLSADSPDRAVWQFAQDNDMVLLTDNRNLQGNDSLEQTIREQNTEACLPVVTVSNVERLYEREYRENCVLRLVEIILDIEELRGSGRLFIP